MSYLKQYIIDTPDFPSKGIVFKDFFPLLRDHLDETIDELIKLTSWDGIDYIAGIESRGFILASAIASKLGIGFVPVRKKGKLPPPFISESYSLEYGSDTLEIHPAPSAKKIIIIDDVLATGGTLKASIKLCEKAGYTVVNSIVLIDITAINDMRNSHGVRSVIQY